MGERKDQERRDSPRYLQSCELRGKRVSLLGSPIENRGEFRGRIQNISRGGFCLLTDQLMVVSCLIRCEVFFPEIPIAIPTLMQVRWTQKNSKQHRYLIGLQFLL